MLVMIFSVSKLKGRMDKSCCQFEERWQTINCGGALDGKHVRIMPPPGSGAQYYNYKNFYSIVLMALVDANYQFTYVDVGKNGRVSGVVEHTTFYQKLIQGLLNLPDNEDTVENLNYIFVGDEAFPLHKHVLKPFSQRDVNHHRRLYNYRVSRARNIVENTFGLIASRFRILHTSIGIRVDKIIHVLAMCALHNLLRRSCYRTLLGHLLIEKIWRRMKLSQVTGGKKLSANFITTR
jgi:hypothetical protein